MGCSSICLDVHSWILHVHAVQHLLTMVKQTFVLWKICVCIHVDLVLREEITFSKLRSAQLMGDIFDKSAVFVEGATCTKVEISCRISQANVRSTAT